MEFVNMKSMHKTLPKKKIILQKQNLKKQLIIYRVTGELRITNVAIWRHCDGRLRNIASECIPTILIISSIDD